MAAINAKTENLPADPASESNVDDTKAYAATAVSNTADIPSLIETNEDYKRFKVTTLETAPAGGGSGGNVTVDEFAPAAVAQLRAANIIFRNNAPQMGPMTLFSGCDHLQANGNGKSFRNPAGTWPLTGRTIYLEVTVGGKSTRDEGVILVESGEEQEIICQMRRQVLVDADILFGTGHYLVVAESVGGERFPIRGGELEVSYGVKPAA